MTEAYNYYEGSDFDPGPDPTTFTPAEAALGALVNPVRRHVVQTNESLPGAHSVAAGEDMALPSTIYDPAEFEPNSAIGQHILKDGDVLRQISELVPIGGSVVEIGAGPGTLTRYLLGRSGKVTAYEIDRRCEPMLDHLADETGKLTVRWGDFIESPNEELEAQGPIHLVGNIPFQISETLMNKMRNLDFRSAVLLIGKRLLENMTAPNPDNPTWNRLSLVTRAYFNVEDVVRVPRASFDPPPRTDAGVVRVTRKDDDPSWRSDAVARSYRAIVEAADTNSTVAKALKNIVLKPNGDAETTAPRRSNNRRAERRTGRAALKGVVQDFNNGGRSFDVSGTAPTGETMLSIVAKKVDERLLSKPMSGLSNSDLAKICGAITTEVNRRKKRR